MPQRPSLAPPQAQFFHFQLKLTLLYHQILVHIYNYKKPQKEIGNSLVDENVIIYFAIIIIILICLE